MKKSRLFKWSGFGLLAVMLMCALVFVFLNKKSSSRIVLADEMKEHRQLLHNAAGDHACNCFQPIIANVTFSNILSTSVDVSWHCGTDAGGDGPSTYQVTYSNGVTTSKDSVFPKTEPTVSYVTHTVTVPNLKPNTTYHMGVKSYCLSNCYRGGGPNYPKTFQQSNGVSDWTITTAKAVAVLQENAPAASCAISEVAAAKVTAKDVTITWKTNTPATSLVEYGRTQAYGMKSGLSDVLVRNHDIQLFELTLGATYHFRAVSYAGSAKASATVYSSDMTFKVPSSEERIADVAHIIVEPNPASSWTMFNYMLYQPVKRVTIDIFTLSGKLVNSLESPSSSLHEGWNKVRWDHMTDSHGKSLVNGLYVYKMRFQTVTNNVEEMRSSSLRVQR